MKSFFIGRYEIKLPIIQGGMGVGVSLSGLASAVANEGGLGVISAAGIGLLYPNMQGSYLQKCIYGLQEELRKAREKTNSICLFRYYTFYIFGINSINFRRNYIFVLYLLYNM